MKVEVTEVQDWVPTFISVKDHTHTQAYLLYVRRVTVTKQVAEQRGCFPQGYNLKSAPFTAHCLLLSEHVGYRHIGRITTYLVMHVN